MEAGKRDPAQQEQATAENGSQPKSAKELEKARLKAQKLQKFAEKQKHRPANGAQAVQSAKQKEQAKVEVSYKDFPVTPKGQKKELLPIDDPLCKAYLPNIVESGWYDWWEAEGFFKPDLTDSGTTKANGYFVITQPPPNVTGALHCGHAMAVALQDTMIRWNRMKGLTVLYVPGCDHAGISTQSVVEKMLWRRQKTTRHDLGRQKMVDLIWEWKEEYHLKINAVLKRLGGSQDWSREAFTMDENLSAAVIETFCRLHDEGLIYRSDRLVNWCTHLNTALSNLEVINVDVSGRTLLSVPGYDRKVEFGVLTYFKYPIEDSEETIEIATTRPETMLGDTAIAVNPADHRYKHLIGKRARHPLVDRFLPIIADDYVDTEFGTGAVKITPAHDTNDFDIGKRHDLEFINILNDDGTLNENAGSFAGQKRFDARYSVTDALVNLGLFIKKVDNPMKIPICEKSKDVIEPLIKPQWWMNMRNMASEAVSAVRDGKITIRPQTASKNYFHWMENIGDWCLSRQLWWGHQIPAYLVTFTDENQATKTKDEIWVTGRTLEEARQKASAKYVGQSFELTRDPDVLDTWFSSALWPFSTLGWPKETTDFQNFYPTSMLETGWDILFFWVARMIMMGIKLTGEIPFSEVYCHCIVRDTEGRKMSKSLGNVIDPVDVIEGISLQALQDKLLLGNLDPNEIAKATKFQQQAFSKGIPECGADALRFCLIQYCTGGGDINFDINVMHGYRKFCNKIYQATKYVLGKFGELGDDFNPQPNASLNGHESLAERWILHKLTMTAKAVDVALTAREFSKAAQLIYQYWYDDLCDVYIENSKSIIREGSCEQARSAVDTLYTALDAGLTMLHPFMPFLTEELWQRLPRRPGDTVPSIMLATYPQFNPDLEDQEAESTYDTVLGCSKAIRSLCNEYSMSTGVQAYLLVRDTKTVLGITEHETSIVALCGKVKPILTILSPAEVPPLGCAVATISSTISVLIYVKDRIQPEEEVRKMELKAKQAAVAAAKQQTLVGASDFTAKTSLAVQEAERQRLENLLAQQSDYEKSLEQFRRMVLEHSS